MTIREQIELCEREALSQYASAAANTRGRERHSPLCENRTEYQRDRDRIIHCKAFRRLMNKTQVFLCPEDDHYRTRLTHTLEVCQIARTVARALRLNEDLTEAIALGHDLGHTPFGHAGEEVLAEICEHGFIHSRQSVRVVETLENGGKGLNLTWEVRNGIRCHSYGDEAETLEGRLVRYADKIAYMNHDIDDAVRASILKDEDIPKRFRDELGASKSDRITTFVNALIDNSGSDISLGGYLALYEELKSFLFKEVYINPAAKKEEHKAKEVVRRLYGYFLDRPDALPEEYQKIARDEDIPRAACDYISGMSDRFCIAVFEELFVPRSWDG